MKGMGRRVGAGSTRPSASAALGTTHPVAGRGRRLTPPLARHSELVAHQPGTVEFTRLTGVSTGRAESGPVQREPDPAGEIGRQGRHVTRQAVLPAVPDDQHTCRVVLDTLVDSAYLRETSAGVVARGNRVVA